MIDNANSLRRPSVRAQSAPAVAPPVSPQARQQSRQESPGANKASGLATLTFALVVLSVLGYAWSVRAERHISADTGWGYWLGVAGSLMMLTLALYPLRKKLKSMRGVGKVSTWFRSHMFLGIVGPALIILHSNFRLSAINNTVAMVAMLVVVASGLVARFLYAKVHHGLHGQRAEFSTLYRNAQSFREVFMADVSYAPTLVNELKAGEQRIFSEAQTARQSLMLAIRLRLSRRSRHRALMAEAERVMSAIALRNRIPVTEFNARLKYADGHLRDYQNSLIKAAGLRFYERLFSLWHHLHMPLFFLLIASALVHVVAVHLY